MKYTYLIVDLCSLIPTFLFSFHPKIQFYKKWKMAIPSILIVAIIFVVWDMYYTKLGVWGFNPTYLTGIQIGNLPIEEVMFFICIPYACLYSYHCYGLFIKKRYGEKYQSIISSILILGLILFALKYSDQLYTGVTFALLSLVLFLFEFVFKLKWLIQFYKTYVLLLIPFTIVNGILTGTSLDSPVVWYNPNEIIGWRILTIPFEDVFYGMLMLISSISIFEYFNSSYRAKISVSN